MAFAVADLVHPNHPQSIELAPLIPLLGNHPLDDPSHRTPRHSEIVRYGADVRPLCQPRYLLFEALGKAAPLVGPRHLFFDHATTPTNHSPDRVAKIAPDRNALQAAPIFGLQRDYLKALATEMTCRGAVALPEADARAIVAAIARELTNSGQIEPVGGPTVLATLTAHHVLELVDYPQTAFRFEPTHSSASSNVFPSL